jgi:hypothetical protein
MVLNRFCGAYNSFIITDIWNVPVPNSIIITKAAPVPWYMAWVIRGRRY